MIGPTLMALAEFNLGSGYFFRSNPEQLFSDLTK